jgi:DNA-binding NarL/FixJ family response regulator
MRISPATVRNHIQRILGKLKVHSRLQAVLAARRGGWL